MPGANCLLGICCPPRSPSAKKSLAEELARGTDMEAQYCAKAAHWILDNYDLMPLNSTDSFKAEIARLARENP
jgi:hypothetical protein